MSLAYFSVAVMGTGAHAQDVSAAPRHGAPSGHAPHAAPGIPAGPPLGKAAGGGGCFQAAASRIVSPAPPQCHCMTGSFSGGKPGSIAGTSGGNSGPSCGILILSHLLQAIGTPQKVSEVKLLEDNTGRKVVEHSLQCPARYETAP